MKATCNIFVFPIAACRLVRESPGEARRSIGRSVRGVRWPGLRLSNACGRRSQRNRLGVYWGGLLPIFFGSRATASSCSVDFVFDGFVTLSLDVVSGEKLYARIARHVRI